jgi:hypothetical protein
LRGIKTHALEWKEILGNSLLNVTVRAMNELKTTIDYYRSEVELVVNGLERFKIVMQCISTIKKMCIEAEVKYLQYQVC